MTGPRVARSLLGWCLPSDHRRVVLGDLDEEFASLVIPSRGISAARRWYWRHVIASLPGALRLRWRGSASGFGRDVRHGARLLRRHPAFGATAVLTLAIGIAAASAVATVADAVLRRPLAFASPDELIIAAEQDRTRATSGNVSWPDYLDYRDRTRTLSGLAGFSGGSRTLAVAGRAEQVSVGLATDTFFDVLGVRPALGRAFQPDDLRAGAPIVVLLTHGAWARRFGGDPAVVGRSLDLNGGAALVIGVLPASFEFPLRGSAEFWLPIRPSTAQRDRRYFHWMDLVGRLAPGVTRESAEAELDAIARSFAGVDPRNHANAGMRVRPLRDAIVGDTRAILLVLLASAGFVLAATCANIAGLLLARTPARAREIDVRLAIGATPFRIVRQLAAENLALAIPAGLAGTVLGQWAVHAFIAAMPMRRRAALPHLQSLSIDPAALAWAAAMTIGAAVAFGLAPAWRARRRTMPTTPRGSSGGTRGELRLQSALVGVQVALALTLLFGAALVGQSLRRLLDVEPGFSTTGLAMGTVAFAGARYQSADAARTAHRDLLDRLAADTSISGAATIDQPPLTGRGNSGAFTIRSREDRTEHPTLIRTVSANYFDVMHIPLVSGRGFGPEDAAGTPPVVLVNQRLADAVFAGAPIGEGVVFQFFPNQPVWQIVGIVGDEQFNELDTGRDPVLYFPYAQTPSGGYTVLARARADPAQAIDAIRRAVVGLDPKVPVYGTVTIDRLIGMSEPVFRRRTVLVLFAAFAGVAVVLCGIGLYGVLAQGVAARTRELGVRVALGAGRAQIVGTVLRRGLVATGVGLAVGLAGCAALGISLESLVFGVGRFDLVSISVASAGLALVAIAACVAPARRASRVDPALALRREA